MIMNSGRFSGGGGGGSNRDVVFTARVDTKDARRELASLAKDVDAVQKQIGSMRMGGGGGVGGGGRSGGVSGTPSVVLGDSAYDRQQRNFFDRAIREETRAIKQAAAERARDMKNLKKDTKDAMEGLIGLSRAFVLFGVSSEENMEKAVRALARFEGAVAGYKGGMKLAEGLGGLLGRGAGRLGIAAGGGTTALGAAGIAAGVGVLGGGAAIWDTIQYNRTGKIGAYSRGMAGFYSDVSRWGYNWGLATEEELRNAPTPYGRLAASDIGYERQLGSSLEGLYERMPGEQSRLGDERFRLSQMERQIALQKQADARRLAGSMSYAALSPWDQRGVNKLRDRFLKDPNSLSNRELMGLTSGNYIGAFEEKQAQAIIKQRTAGFTSRGFREEDSADAMSRGLKIDQVKLQRELVLKLEVENKQTVDAVETIVNRALDTANEDLAKRIEDMERRANERMKMNEMQQQLRTNSQINGFGGGQGF